jgi:hypothetical protein
MIVDFSEYGVFTEDEEDDNTRSSKSAAAEIQSNCDVGSNIDRGDSEATDDSDDINWSSDEDDESVKKNGDCENMGSSISKNEECSSHLAPDLGDGYSSQQLQPIPTSTTLDQGGSLSCPAASVENPVELAIIDRSTSVQLEAPEVISFSMQQRQSVAESLTSPATISNFQGQVDGSSSSSGSSSCSSSGGEDERTQMRRLIIAIRKDASLTEHGKRIRIQALMDNTGTSARASGLTCTTNDLTSTVNIETAKEQQVTKTYQSKSDADACPYELSGPLHCPHYDSKCRIVTPCCRKIYGCRVCHDETVEEQQSDATAALKHGPLDRFSIQEIICNQCGMLQNSKT